MKNAIIVSLFVALSLAAPSLASAKDSVWSQGLGANLFYCWTYGSSDTSACGYGNVGQYGQWSLGLLNPTVQVQYHATITNLSTGAQIGDGSSVPVGTRVRLAFTPHQYYDIYWFGSGYSADSPYGTWGTGAPAVACNSNDYVTTVNYIRTFDVYIPLVVTPPSKAISNLGNLNSCTAFNGSYMDCTVASAGTIAPQFNFAYTEGTFYYRYYEREGFFDNYSFFYWAPGCYGNPMPMAAGGGYVTDGYYGTYPTGGLWAYTVSVPAQTISFTFSAYNPSPTASISASPASIVQGSSASLVYSSSNAASCTINQGVGAVTPNTSGTRTVNPTVTTTYTITCTGSSGGSATSAATVTVTIPAPAASCSAAAPTTIYQGASKTWTATASGGLGAPYTYSWSGTDGLSGTSASVSKTYTAVGTKSGSVIVTSGGQSTTAACSNSVTVNSCTPTLSASPTNLTLGQSSTLTWAVPAGCTTGGGGSVSSCTFSDSASSFGTSGTRTVTPPAPAAGNTAQYAITCGAYTAQVPITVTVPGGAITATPDRIAPGGSATVAWGATNVTSCTVTGTDGYTRAPQAGPAVATTTVVRTINSQTKYTLTCTTAGSPMIRTAIVNVTAGFKEF